MKDSQLPVVAGPTPTPVETVMLKALALKFWEECKNKDVLAAMKTLAKILEKASDTGELLFGASAVDDLDAEFEALTELRGEMMKACSCGDGSCVMSATGADASAAEDGNAIDPALVLALIDLALKLIARFRKK